MMDTLARIRSWDREDVHDLKALIEEARDDPVIKWFDISRAYREHELSGDIENYLINPCGIENLIGVDKSGRGLIEYDYPGGEQYQIYKPHHTSSIVKRLLTWLQGFVYDQIRVRERQVRS